MAGKPKTRERKLRTEAVITDVHSIDELVSHIASGGDLAGWCRVKDIKFTDINLWIQGEEARRKRYAEALALRDTHQKDRVNAELRTILDADIADAYDEHGALLSVKDMPLSIRRAIASIEVDEIFEGRGEDRHLVGYTRKVKLWDKVKGVELMARKNKMLTDKVESSHRVTLADLLTEEGAS